MADRRGNPAGISITTLIKSPLHKSNTSVKTRGRSITSLENKSTDH